ncbi:unnamed protein product, partial [Mesorhabditis spiculigera]
MWPSLGRMASSATAILLLAAVLWAPTDAATEEPSTTVVVPEFSLEDGFTYIAVPVLAVLAVLCGAFTALCVFKRQDRAIDVELARKADRETMAAYHLKWEVEDRVREMRRAEEAEKRKQEDEKRKQERDKRKADTEKPTKEEDKLKKEVSQGKAADPKQSTEAEKPKKEESKRTPEDQKQKPEEAAKKPTLVAAEKPKDVVIPPPKAPEPRRPPRPRAIGRPFPVGKIDYEDRLRALVAKQLAKVPLAKTQSYKENDLSGQNKASTEKPASGQKPPSGKAGAKKSGKGSGKKSNQGKGSGRVGRTQSISKEISVTPPSSDSLKVPVTITQKRANVIAVPLDLIRSIEEKEKEDEKREEKEDLGATQIENTSKTPSRKKPATSKRP